MTIRVGWVVTPGHMAPLIEALGKREPAVFKHLGQSYVLQPLRFNGTTPQIQAQAIGELEVASFSHERARAGDHQCASRRAARGRRRRGRSPRLFQREFRRAGGWPDPARSRTSRAAASPPMRSARPAIPRCGRCSASTASRTAISPPSRRISPTCRRCSNSGKVDIIGTLPQFAPELEIRQVPGAVHRPRRGRADAGGRLGDAQRCNRRTSAGLRRFLRGSHPRRSAGFSIRRTARRRSRYWRT